jgi:hypothetical protein
MFPDLRNNLKSSGSSLSQMFHNLQYIETQFYAINSDNH